MLCNSQMNIGATSSGIRAGWSCVWMFREEYYGCKLQTLVNVIEVGIL